MSQSSVIISRMEPPHSPPDTHSSVDINAWRIIRDVSNQQTVQRVITEIRDTCPRIAGVANGAMVLKDTLLADMSLEQMEQVLKPKIDGSNYLAEALHDDKLDFFVMFSSLSAVVGNAGQANYAGANAYMQSLAKQRRKRGLAASSFDIGRVVGIGFVARASDVVKDQLDRMKFMPISEGEFHQLFAETILASHPDVQTASPALTTAFFSVFGDDDDEYMPGWTRDPRFSHCLQDSSQGTQVQGESKSNDLPVFEQLETAKNMEDALGIVKGIATPSNFSHNIDRSIKHGILSKFAAMKRNET